MTSVHTSEIEDSIAQRLDYLDILEAESIYILREVVAQCEVPVMLYSAGKDSSALLRVMQKAFAPARIPFPVLHIDTGYKFPEMYEFRDRVIKEAGAELRIYKNDEAIGQNANPYDLGTSKCCGLLKTQGLLQGLAAGGYTAAIGGARRDEEKSRAKERVFSVRDRFGRWEPRQQRPELWSLYNARLTHGETVRVFPLSNWTELDVWLYIYRESVDVVPLYFAKRRQVLVRGNLILPYDKSVRLLPGEEPREEMIRYRSLGCMPCTGAVFSNAVTLEEVIYEMFHVRLSERAFRVIDHDQHGSMELKKREGYF